MQLEEALLDRGREAGGVGVVELFEDRVGWLGSSSERADVSRTEPDGEQHGERKEPRYSCPFRTSRTYFLLAKTISSMVPVPGRGGSRSSVIQPW